MPKHYSVDIVNQQIREILESWGMPVERAQQTADIMADADLAGIDSHGISMIPGYQRLVDAGELDVSAVAHLTDETATTAVIDGRHALGHLTTATAMETAILKARDNGVGVVGVRRSRHFGAAGHYAALAAGVGLIGLVTSTTRTRAVTPTRGTRPLLGTNPLAFAAPTTRKDAPFVLDMSTSTVAVNKVKVYDYDARPLPGGWVVDDRGAPITDSKAAYSLVKSEGAGGLTPLGGEEATSSHKGYGLAVMVQILAGALTGTTFGHDRNDSPDDGVGHFCLAIDPGYFGNADAFEQSVTELLETLRAEPSLNADRPVLVAGDKERATRAERRRSGVPLSPTLVSQLRSICERTGARFHL